MPRGPGKYDELCTAVRALARAEGVLLIVINGARGSGFAVQAPPEISPAALADVLQRVVDQIRADAKRGVDA